MKRLNFLDIARMATPLMSEADRAEAEAILGSLTTANSLEALPDAAAAFRGDMQPIVTAIAAALQHGDLAAFKGLRTLLPHLLAEVNAQPALADLLAHEVGAAVLAGMKEDEA